MSVSKAYLRHTKILFTNQTLKRATTPLKRNVPFRARHEPYCSQSLPFHSQNASYRAKSVQDNLYKNRPKTVKKANRTVQ